MYIGCRRRRNGGRNGLRISATNREERIDKAPSNNKLAEEKKDFWVY